MKDYPKEWISGPLCMFIQPQKEKVAPSNFPNMPFIGMDHVEPHTTKITGSVEAKRMKSNAVRFSDNDVLYGRLRPYLNKVAQPRFDGLASAEFIVFRGNELIDPAFLRLRLSALDFVSFASHLNEGDRPRVSFDQIGSFNVWLPPPQEQRRIVEKLEALFDEIDKGVESLRAAKSTLDLYRKSLLKSAFEGRLTADWRAKNPDKLEDPEALLARIRKEREHRHQAAIRAWERDLDEWKQHGSNKKKPVKPKPPPQLRPLSIQSEVPSNWVKLTLVSLGIVQTGTTPRKSMMENFGGDMPFFKPTDLEAGDNVREAREFLSETGLDTSRRFAPGTILVTCIGATIGKTGLSVVEGSCNQQINFLEPYESADSKFMYFQICSPAFQELIKNNASSTTLPILNKKRFSQLPARICSPAEQAEIVRILDERLEAANRLEFEFEAALAHAEALRQSILKNAFSGHLVPQDPNDEPAATLLQRILAKKASHNLDRAKSRVSTA